MTKRSRLLLAGLFVLHALPFLTRPALIGGDEPHYALMAYSLGVEGNVDLEPDYIAVEAGAQAAGRKFAGRRLDRHYVEHDGDSYFSHPLGIAALAAPFVALLHAAAPAAAPDLLLGLLGLGLTFAALIAGYRLLLLLDLPSREAAFLTFALYFATPLWFYGRLFFTESYSWSFTVLAIYLMSRHHWLAASIALGATFLIKEPNVLFILAVLAGLWRLRGLGRAVLVALGPLAAFVVWLAKNLWIYGEAVVMFQPYQTGDPLAGTLGLLFDPRHGLLPFAPILGLCLVVGWRRLPATSPVARLELPALVAFLTTFGMTAWWNIWGGGSCYGPRLLVPAIPALTLSLVTVWRGARLSRTGRAVFAFLAGLGFTIQLLAAMDPFQAFWEIAVGDLLTARPGVTLAALVLGLGAATLLSGSDRLGRATR